MIVFHTLDKENMKKIVSLLCNEFTGRLEKQMNIHLKLRNSAKELIVEKGTDTKYGARPLRRALQTELEDKLADAILNGDIRPGDHVEAGASKKEIRFFIKSSQDESGISIEKEMDLLYNDTKISQLGNLSQHLI